jgi:phenylpropionate dioxygenase-like ring-hydroxylating dioxygenase large terminal subunit
MNDLTNKWQKPFSDELRALGTDPVPAAPYHDERWFDLEREAIFKRTWLNVAHVCELPEPNSFIVRELEFARASIIIARGKNGEIRAFHNVCTHRGTQLTREKAGKQPTFRCPYHMWTFGTDGRFLSAPDFERFYISDKSQCDLAKVSVDVCAGLIFVNLDRNPKQGLKEFLGPMGEMISGLPIASATTYDEYVYDIDANWKVTFDNFQENYHLRFVHRRTNGSPPLDSKPNPFHYPVAYETFGPHRMDTSPGGGIPDPDSKPLAGFLLGKLGEQVMADGLIGGPHDQDYFIFFPKLYVFGNPTMHFTHLVNPVSAGKSRGVFRFYWIGDDRTARERVSRELALSFAREIHVEDCETIASAQRGIGSGAIANFHFQEQEVLCRHLLASVQARVRDYLEEQRERQPA